MITGERYVVLGLGSARTAWFSDLARLATAGAVPIEFVKSVTAEETRVRLTSGRSFSALLVDGGLPSVDRDLLDDARRSGVEVFVVADPRVIRDWWALGATAVLPREFSVEDLISALDGMTKAIPRGVADAAPVAAPVRVWAGELVAVTGARGSGASTIAAAIAQGFVAGHRPGAILLADLALDADQGLLHHAPDIVPGLPELVEAHRGGSLGESAVHSMVFDVEERGYHLLLGIRRRRGWSSLRPRALDAALDSLLAAYPIVVGDIDPDVDGHQECGSFEVEDRNAMARAVLARARATVVVGTATTGGLHSLAQALRDMLEHGVDPLRLVTVVNHAPRSPREPRGHRSGAPPARRPRHHRLACRCAALRPHAAGRRGRSASGASPPVAARRADHESGQLRPRDAGARVRSARRRASGTSRSGELGSVDRA